MIAYKGGPQDALHSHTLVQGGGKTNIKEKGHRFLWHPVVGAQQGLYYERVSSIQVLQPGCLSICF
jgi:heterodisulfide reductase subunit B